jgi:hypothetical protein
VILSSQTARSSRTIVSPPAGGETLAAHPAADLFPHLGQTELTALADEIRAYLEREPAAPWAQAVSQQAHWQREEDAGED